MDEKNSTEFILQYWRDGQVHSERLCAGLLQIESFESVDPQCPLGGADGLKDIICEKNNKKYIGAASFSKGEKDFSKIKNKFIKDLKGVSSNEVDGIIFFINQQLTLDERKNLKEIGADEGADVSLYHLERMRAILDSPKGYGLRLQYLKIPMNMEEQSAYLTDLSEKWEQIISTQVKGIKDIKKDIKDLRQTINPYLMKDEKGNIKFPPKSSMDVDNYLF